MVTSADWIQKIIALLHDPPDKALHIRGHEEEAQALLRTVLKGEPDDTMWQRAKDADRIAAAADRVDFPEGEKGVPLSVDFQQRPILCHPLAGRQLDLAEFVATFHSTDTRRIQEEAIRGLSRSDESPRKRFLRLWRGLPDALREAENRMGLPPGQRLGHLWSLLPADTRMPDHSLMQHLSTTAALASALPQPALLVFSLGPVQRFIATARKTQDLWMGSYILSYLAWQGMKEIATEWGPDVLIYPSLHGQPLADLWLCCEEEVWERKPEDKELRIATFPNKFVALLPTNQARKAAEKAERAVREAWKNLGKQVQNALEDCAGVNKDKDTTWSGLWQKQVPWFLEIYWCVYPWPGMDGAKHTGDPELTIAQYRTLCCPPVDWPFKQVYNVYVQVGQYHPNIGTTYGLLYDLADRGFNARKGLRNFGATEERGAKCTLCGQRQALRTEEKDEREFWKALATALQQRGRYEVKPDGAERLCAVCAVKRFVRQEVFDQELGLKGGFPSTSTMASAAFCQRLLSRLAQPHSDKLWDAFQTFLRALQQSEIPKTNMDLPLLERLADQLPSAKQEIAKDFLKYDGDWLFEETYSVERVRKDYNLECDEATLFKVRDALRRLLREMGESPSRYFAVLSMDGDHAGRWLSGTHGGFATFGDVLHPDIKQDLSGRPGWSDLLKERRLMSPAVHTAISQGLTNFALKVVPWVVEERYPGRLVYAGGDDVVALLPIEYALAAARELRAFFSGEVVTRSPDNLEVQFCSPKASGYLYKGEPMLTMGPTATASIGVAIAHHRSPLDSTLNAMREAEKAAKNLYGRNALCLHLLKRSGEQVRVGAKWFYPDAYLGRPTTFTSDWQRQWGKDIPDSIHLLEEMKQRFVEGKLSGKFPYVLFAESQTLAALAPDVQEAELKRLIKRHKQGQWHPQEKRESEMVCELAKQLARLAQALHTHCPKREPSPDEPQPGMVELAKWLLLVRFMVSGGAGE